MEEYNTSLHSILGGIAINTVLRRFLTQTYCCVIFSLKLGECSANKPREWSMQPDVKKKKPVRELSWKTWCPKRFQW